MGKEKTCRAVPNHGLPNQVRVSCSKCGTIWEEGEVKGSCPVCHKRIKPSKFSNKFSRKI